MNHHHGIHHEIHHGITLTPNTRQISGIYPEMFLLSPEQPRQPDSRDTSVRSNTRTNILENHGSAS